MKIITGTIFILTGIAGVLVYAWWQYNFVIFPPIHIKGPYPCADQAILMKDGFLLLLFGIQHSLMARQGWKKSFSNLVPFLPERLMYVASSGISLGVMCFLWEETGWVYECRNWWSVVTILLQLFAICLMGLSVLTMNGKNLIGVGALQVWTGKSEEMDEFHSPGFYKIVRHPLYLGFIISWWAHSMMTADRLLFAIGMTVYILIAIELEERDLKRKFGIAYENYCKKVKRLIPFIY